MDDLSCRAPVYDILMSGIRHPSVSGRQVSIPLASDISMSVVGDGCLWAMRGGDATALSLTASRVGGCLGSIRPQRRVSVASGRPQAWGSGLGGHHCVPDPPAGLICCPRSNRDEASRGVWGTAMSAPRVSPEESSGCDSTRPRARFPFSNCKKTRRIATGVPTGEP